MGFTCEFLSFSVCVFKCPEILSFKNMNVSKRYPERSAVSARRRVSSLPCDSSLVSSSLAQFSSSSSSSNSTYTSKVQVSVRVKPSLTDTPIADPGLWQVHGSRIAVRDVGEFTYDHVFAPISLTTPSATTAATTPDVFSRAVRSVLDRVLDGYSATVFAYGTTGSGKTYTMKGSEDNPGIVPLSARYLFDRIANSSNEGIKEKNEKISSSPVAVVKLSYLEIYNEVVNDLLAPGTMPDEIKIRDDPARGGPRAFGLAEVEVRNPEELVSLIADGDRLRRTEGTEHNASSSRSHAIVQITLTRGTGSVATLYLCDLAGSERAVAASERRKEGSFINKSLLTLGTVIARLAASSQSSSILSSASLSSSNLQSSTTTAAHIPYRDSKLTRILQPALSGRSVVSVLCTVDFENTASVTETINTLRFASRARNLPVAAKRSVIDSGNHDSGGQTGLGSSLSGGSGGALREELDKATLTIQRLRDEVQALRIENGAMRRARSDRASSYTMQLQAENIELRERIEQMAGAWDEERLDGVLELDASDKESGNEEDNNGDGGEGVSMLDSKAYILSLEKQLLEHRVRTITSPSLAKSGSLSVVPDIPLPSLRPTRLSGSFPDSPPELNEDLPGLLKSMGQNQQPQQPVHAHYLEKISELREELEELRNSNIAKDQIITSLRWINERRGNEF